MGTVVSCIAILAAQYLGKGDRKTADIYLVYGLGMGAKGTAITTVAVSAVELVCVLLYCHRKGRIHPRLSSLVYFSRVLVKAFFVYPRFKKYLWLKNLTREFS